MIVAFLRRSGFPGCAQGDRVHVASSFMEMSDGSEGFGLSFMSKALRRCEREKLSDGMREGGVDGELQLCSSDCYAVSFGPETIGVFWDVLEA